MVGLKHTPKPGKPRRRIVITDWRRVVVTQCVDPQNRLSRKIVSCPSGVDRVYLAPQVNELSLLSHRRSVVTHSLERREDYTLKCDLLLCCRQGLFQRLLSCPCFHTGRPAGAVGRQPDIAVQCGCGPAAVRPDVPEPHDRGHLRAGRDSRAQPGAARRAAAQLPMVCTASRSVREHPLSFTHSKITAWVP
jgi:hypothetical protein